MAADETVALVNERNEVIGATTRRQMRAERLLHRATYILVFNQAGEILVQKRTPTKDMYPGYYDLAAGGVVLDGESYEASAAREAEEELGLVDVPLEPRFDFYFEDDRNRIFGRAFTCVYEGPFVLQPEEVESGAFLSIEDALAARLGPVTPDTLQALREYLDRHGGPPVAGG